MKMLDKSGKHMIVEGTKIILASNKVLLADHYAGACMPGAPESTTFRANHSYGYALCCKAALSNPPDTQSSGISMIYLG